MQDNEILGRIGELIDEEHQLRSRITSGEAGTDDHGRIKNLEESLDQCWDLLRQRRARRGIGENPDGAVPRPVSEVEGYQQ
ncbi:DUF2630 family protein [Herbidospora mongoliensis]|uniref:DUF2630 family protein n=1 Tax=Herbidospora mongoliensis TaxID=688067 RepID=UPI0008330415|nr:DUF2630 family protein [Herbidospora mongoliensis]